MEAYVQKILLFDIIIAAGLQSKVQCSFDISLGESSGETGCYVDFVGRSIFFEKEIFRELLVFLLHVNNLKYRYSKGFTFDSASTKDRSLEKH